MTQPAYANLILNRSYRLVQQIAEGSTGRVFRAEHLSPEAGPRPIGLRLVPAGHPSLPRLMDRLPALSRIPHANLSTVHTMGQVTGGLFADSIFFAWDYGDVSLAGLLERAEPIPPSEVVLMATHLSAALEALHDADLTHRALRPENVLRVGTNWCLADPQPDITVRDILRRAERDVDLSRLAPEVLEGEYGPAADMWALGAILRRAFTRLDAPRSLPAQVAELIDSRPSLPAGTPPPLDLLLHSLALPDPLRRYDATQVQALMASRPVPPGVPAPVRKASPRTGARRGLGRRLGTWASPGTALAWLDADVACGCADGSMVVFSPGTPRPRSGRPHQGLVSVLRATETGLVSGGWDGRVLWLDPDLAVLAEVALGAPVLALSPDLVAITADGVVHQVEPNRAHPIGTLEAGLCAWTDTERRPAVGTLTGRVVWGNPAETLDPWEATIMAGDAGVAVGWNGSILRGRDLEEAGGPVRSVVPISNGVVCGLHDGALLLLRGTTRLRLEGHTGSVRALAVSPDGRRLASGGQDKQVLSWDIGDL